jgi:hypothetical protein
MQDLGRWVFRGSIAVIIGWLLVIIGISLRCPIWNADSCGDEAAMWLFPVMTLPVIIILALAAYWLRRKR